jgi:hypothetical protein
MSIKAISSKAAVAEDWRVLMVNEVERIPKAAWLLPRYSDASFCHRQFETQKVRRTELWVRP